MKMVKSLLLGSAAGLVAVAGAQAADLPVKAKPVEYVKVCSAYGAGFYYIPGTDICLRVGGYLWSELEVNNRGAGTQVAGTGANRDRGDDWISWRVRNVMIFDARTNTEYGTLRSYFSGGWQWTTSNAGNIGNGIGAGQAQAFGGGATYNAVNWEWYYDRAFIQFAGLTFGYIGSFFDFDPSMILDQQFSKSFKFTPAIAYTAQFGNGISATISMEDATSRRNQITDVAWSTATLNTNLYAAQFSPNWVANLRVDQAWGDAQISAATMQVKCSNQASGAAAGAIICAPAATDKWAYAFLGGVNFKLPNIAPGDSWQVEAAWSKGGVDFVGVSGNPYQQVGLIAYRTHSQGPILDLFDAFVDGTGLHLTKAWSINTQFRHFWTPTLRSTIAYGYLSVDVPSEANLANHPDFHNHQVTANLIWSPVKNLDLGLEAFWVKNTGSCATATCSNGAVGTTALGGKSSIDYFGGLFRARRDF